MQLFRFAVVILSIGALGTGLALAQLPLEPVKKSGQSISAAYEGWYKNGDGTYTLLVGYFNRNKEESIEIPVGPDNRFEPGEADRGQPTHFQPKRNWGVFTIVMPADFAGKEITWHLTANNKSTKVPMRLNPLWEVEPYRNAAIGNTPPTVRLEADGKEFTGPPSGIAATYEATVSEPLTLTSWANDDDVIDEYRRARAIDPPARVTWNKFRGPGEVTFENTKPEVGKEDGKNTTTVTFSEPGDYTLRLQVNDTSGTGGGGSQCCWTNAHVKVTVKAATDSQ